MSVPLADTMSVRASTAVVAVETLAQGPLDPNERTAARNTALQFIAEASADLATLRAAVEKAKRYKHHVVWYEWLGFDNRWAKTRLAPMAKANALQSAAAMRVDPVLRNIHVFAVYRKQKTQTQTQPVEIAVAVAASSD